VAHALGQNLAALGLPASGALVATSGSGTRSVLLVFAKDQGPPGIDLVSPLE
jgi:hypothetical protein